MSKSANAQYQAVHGLVGRTAMHRTVASKPLRTLLQTHIALGKVLDYGCGKGKDLDVLRSLGYKATGYDPIFEPTKPRGKFDTVIVTYVLNVLVGHMREDVLVDAWKHVKRGGRLIVTVRTDKEINREAKRSKWQAKHDGYITGKKTFQKGFNQYELERLLIETLPKARNIQHVPDAGGIMLIARKV